jgi:FMN phosphatase YigB (HAD superfamily)/DNA-binding XRE family transcriptional regulator
MNEVVLGKAIADARKKVGLTQQELCMKADLSYSTLAKIERGAIKSPSVFTVAQIALVTNTTVENMLGISIAADPASPVHTLMKSKSGISFVYFDINGVLVRFFQRAFAQLAHDTGATPDLVETTFWHYNDAVCKGEMSVDEFNSVMARRLGAETIDWLSYYLTAVDPIKEMHHCVAWAAKQYRVGLLSNIFPGFIEALMAGGFLPDVPYASVIDSSEIGALKPDKAIYDAAQALAEVPANEILLIDDDRTNLMAAEKLGWHVMWFDDYRPAESEHRVRQALEA